MKYLCLFAVLMLTNIVLGQESFKKTFRVKDSIKMDGGSYVVLKEDRTLKYKDFTQIQIDSLRKIFKIGDTIHYTVERVVSGEKVMLTERKVITQEFIERQTIKDDVLVDIKGKQLKAYVKFEENKVYINPFLRRSASGFGDRKCYYYELKNRQRIDLNFTEVTVSTLSLPVKYRFKSRSIPVNEEFSTAININLFGGFSIGQTSFFHQEKVGNISNTWKLTGGLLLGASSVKLDSSNTSNAEVPLGEDTELTKGLATVGLGLTYSFNKINIGAFYGWDYCIGNDSEKWNYNRRPWLGLALGYSLFTL